MSGERVDVLAELRTTYCSRESYAAVVELIAAAWRAKCLLREMADAGFGDHGPADDLAAALSRIQPDGQGS